MAKRKRRDNRPERTSDQDRELGALTNRAQNLCVMMKREGYDSSEVLFIASTVTASCCRAVYDIVADPEDEDRFDELWKESRKLLDDYTGRDFSMIDTLLVCSMAIMRSAMVVNIRSTKLVEMMEYLQGGDDA